METLPNHRQVIFDGECPVCTTLKEFAKDRIEDRDLAFIAFQEQDFEQAVPHLPVDEARQALYLVTENGKRLRGSRAVFEIMSEFPGFWGGLGKIFRLPPFYWIAEPFYRLFARHRHRVSKLLKN
jgi:predicted DCC family thiol-disulfide oxidoreductase YuxK